MLGEDLKQSAFIIPVHQNAQLLTLLNLIITQNISNPPLEFLVVCWWWGRHELKAPNSTPRPHPPQRPENVVTRQRQMMNSGPLIVLQKRLDLALPLRPVYWFVQSQEHVFTVVG